MVEGILPAFGLACLGIVIGVLSGLLGVGGGTIMVPVFRLLLHMSPLASTATSLFAVVPTSASGAVTHWRNKTCLVPIGIAAGLGGALMSPLGVRLAAISPAWLVMAAAAAVIIWSAVKMFSKALKKPKAASVPAEAPTATPEPAAGSVAGPVAGASSVSAKSATPAATVQPAAGPVAGASSASVPASSPSSSSSSLAAASATAPARTFAKKDLIKAVLIGLVAGLASGYVGVGGGFLMVPLFITLYQCSMHEASGTSLVAVMILAIPGIVQQGIYGNIDYLVGICIAVGSIPGGILGAKLSKRIPERQLRLIFGCFLLVAAVLLVVNEIA